MPTFYGLYEFLLSRFLSCASSYSSLSIGRLTCSALVFRWVLKIFFYCPNRCCRSGWLWFSPWRVETRPKLFLHYCWDYFCCRLRRGYLWGRPWRVQQVWWFWFSACCCACLAVCWCASSCAWAWSRNGSWCHYPSCLRKGRRWGSTCCHASGVLRTWPARLSRSRTTCLSSGWGGCAIFVCRKLPLAALLARPHVNAVLRWHFLADFGPVFCAPALYQRTDGFVLLSGGRGTKSVQFFRASMRYNLSTSFISSIPGLVNAKLLFRALWWRDARMR